MFEDLFIAPPDLKGRPSSLRRPRKGVIIGAGQVGMACAYSLLIQNVLDEMILVDVNQEKLQGEVMDLTHGLSFVAPTLIKAGNLANGDGDGADIVIITAGAKQKPGESRLDLLQRNVELFKSLIPEVVTHCPEAILLIVTNPVDMMTYVSLKLSGLPSNAVIGSGTVLDTARFRSLLAEKLALDPRSLHAYIIGEHGDSEVPVWSTVNIAGIRLCGGGVEQCGLEETKMLNELFEQVKNAAYEVIQRKGATSYAIGLGVTEIVKAILRDQSRVLTVSSLVTNFQGIDDVCLSLPTIVNCQGVARKIKFAPSPTETRQLQHSAQVLRRLLQEVV